MLSLVAATVLCPWSPLLDFVATLLWLGYGLAVASPGTRVARSWGALADAR